MAGLGHSTLFVVLMKGWPVWAYIRGKANPFIQRGIKFWGTRPTYSLLATYCRQGRKRGKQHHNIYLSNTSLISRRSLNKELKSVIFLVRLALFFHHIQHILKGCHNPRGQQLSFATFQQHKNSSIQRWQSSQTIKGLDKKPEASTRTWNHWVWTLKSSTESSLCCTSIINRYAFPQNYKEGWTMCLLSSQLLRI